MPRFAMPDKGMRRGSARNLAKLILLCGLVCASLCCGCSGSHRAAVSVPEDCQKWLAIYFDALKAKDTAKIEELTLQLSAEESALLPAGSVEMMRETRKASVATLLQKIDQELGDFRSYSVEYCRDTTIAKDDEAANVIGEGRHIEITCSTKYSKRSAKDSFVLYQGPQDPGLIMRAHDCTWTPR